MAFGINRQELNAWKKRVSQGEVAIITHYWQDKRFPKATSVTKVGCNNLILLEQWGRQYHLKPKWIHLNQYPHFDVFGDKQKEILLREGLYDQIKRFNL